MSRSGYCDDLDTWHLIRWRGAVASAIRGKRGQAFLREALAALDALPNKRLITGDLVVDDGDDGLVDHANVCLLGAVGLQRRTDMRGVDPADRDSVAALFDIPHALACEIMHENDEHLVWNTELRRFEGETPEQRYARMRNWVESHIAQSSEASA